MKRFWREAEMPDKAALIEDGLAQKLGWHLPKNGPKTGSKKARILPPTIAAKPEDCARTM